MNAAFMENCHLIADSLSYSCLGLLNNLNHCPKPGRIAAGLCVQLWNTSVLNMLFRNVKLLAEHIKALFLKVWEWRFWIVHSNLACYKITAWTKRRLLSRYESADDSHHINSNKLWLYSDGLSLTIEATYPL